MSLSQHWHAQMITADADLDGAPLFRKPFHLERGHGTVVSAVLRASSLGVYEAWLNGHRVGDDVLSPGWSSYEWRLRYRTYDVTQLIGEANVVGLAVGNGWFRGLLGFQGEQCLYGQRLGAIAELDVLFDDGHRQLVATDETWLAGPSATTANQLYDGQTIDARREPTGWSAPGFDDTAWIGVQTLAFDNSLLTASIGDAIVRHESVAPVRIWASPERKTLVDFGQNLVGWVRFTVRGQQGRVITIRHAEVLEHQELGMRPLRDAQATDTFILSGRLDTFEPTMTFHGFRYIEVDGWPGEVTKDSLEAVVVHSRMDRIGHLETSDEALNQLHQNVVWSLRGNFLGLPTDCPQRNERLGWTGDIAVFAPTAAFLYDVDGFLRDWLEDLAVEQEHAGYVPIVVPDVLKLQSVSTMTDEFSASPTAIWGDAAVWVPWALWEAYGDPAVLDRQFASMADHVRSAVAVLSPTGVWDQGWQFGDWLDPDAPPDYPAAAKADKGVVSTAALYRSAQLVTAAAEVLGRHAEAAEFGAVAERLRSAFGREYVRDNGTIISDCVTVYALAIAFGLLDGDLRDRAGRRLADLVVAADYRITTGFAGTPYVTQALSETGHLGAAYRLLMERQCPSWLYPVSMGATTIWERWDSMLPDGSINSGEMTSFNHYALGAVADWMHRTIGGITPAEPGYRTIRIAPQPGGGLSWVKASLATRRGTVTVGWSIIDAVFTLDVHVPDGCRAEVVVPGGVPVTVGSGQHTFHTGLDDDWATERARVG